MIGRIAGVLLEKNPPHLLVDCNGVGYEVDVPMSTFYNLPSTGERVVLLTQLIVREDAHLLFGFGTAEERATFRELLKISGIGARMALGGALRHERARTGADRHDAGRSASDARAGHRQENGGAPAPRTEGQDRRRPGRDGGRSVGIRPRLRYPERTARIGLLRKRSLAAVKNVPAGTGVSEGIKLALKALSKGLSGGKCLRSAGVALAGRSVRTD